MQFRYDLWEFDNEAAFTAFIDRVIVPEARYLLTDGTWADGAAVIGSRTAGILSAGYLRTLDGLQAALHDCDRRLSVFVDGVFAGRTNAWNPVAVLDGLTPLLTVYGPVLPAIGEVNALLAAAAAALAAQDVYAFTDQMWLLREKIRRWAFLAAGDRENLLTTGERNEH